MKSGKAVANGSKEAIMSRTMVEGPAHASRDFGNGEIVGSSELAPNVVGASPGPLNLARGHAAANNPVIGVVHTPDPEVRIKRRRRHTREYKLSILKQADKLKGKENALGELLRREGLYTAALSQWRKQRDDGLLGQVRGRKPRSEEVLEALKWKKLAEQWEKKCREAILIIEAQKKISEILGVRQDNVPTMSDLDED